MKFVLSLAALLGLVLAVNLAASDSAEARCWKRCRGVVVVPVAPVPAYRSPPVIAVPAPHPIPRREPVRCGGCYASYVYPNYNPPGTIYAYGGRCGVGVRCYPRRDCWYDGYGRRFCN
ncbi:hypothetical protein V6C03_12740 [Methyloligella sp. 2.7D]|uniref:hypothetical protein n=1 Tax=unclassified Methyloligella TaxID=2625955 RepID=UPI00157D2070|nr:hypothetical protein [Methyloligella sp. GL2]QKP77351.1 hypothetical protein HT051_07720 [Methyloligella sp. GL2]